MAIFDINEIASTLPFTIFSPSLAAIFSVLSKVLADVYRKVVYVLGYVLWTLLFYAFNGLSHVQQINDLSGAPIFLAPINPVLRKAPSTSSCPEALIHEEDGKEP